MHCHSERQSQKKKKQDGVRMIENFKKARHVQIDISCTYNIHSGKLKAKKQLGMHGRKQEVVRTHENNGENMEG